MKRIKCITFDKAAQDNLPQDIKDKMKANQENSIRENRIKVVNEIIKEIALRGRGFFLNKKDLNMAYIYDKDGRLYMHNEYSRVEMHLHTKFGYPPKGWYHGGAMWGLVKDFKEYIMNGGNTNHNNGYGGLFCPHWGYPESDMKIIQEKAKDLGYLN